MHLKGLTLRGFKSFASATTLRFEPGIVAVVGPNGSGKSNVVDALAWVMGEQGAKSLRGGKMEDVIFAGTAGRAPLGRAEVSLTIDNTDGSLPIDYTEVTLTRTMFRNGGSEYAINGSSCRLLDIQELLSDSGIGREMHVIVGQGRLDSVLSASPEERRGFIEEAAGVLKHRKRKEKALRKLEAMSVNLARLTDLAAELRRGLKPLGRQAEIARRASVVQADLRDARLRLLADDLMVLRAELAAEEADESALREQRAALAADETALRTREAHLEQTVAEASPQVSATQETYYALSSLRERVRGTASLAAERVRNANRVLDSRPGRDPEELEREAAGVREQERGLAADLTGAQAALSQAGGGRTAAEHTLTNEESALAQALRAAADRREGLARLRGQVNAARSRVQAIEGEISRVDAAIVEAARRGERAAIELATLEEQAAGMDLGEHGLDQAYEQVAGAAKAAAERVGELREAQRAAEAQRTTWSARKEALELGLARKDGAAALLGIGDATVLGSLAELLDVDPGAEMALAAALGRAADGVAVAGLAGAVAGLSWLREHDEGQATLLIGAAQHDGSSSRLPAPGPLPRGRWLVETISAPSALHEALQTLLGRVVLVADLAQARGIVASEPALIAVTEGGDLLGSAMASGGSTSAPSLIEVTASIEEATAAMIDAEMRSQVATTDLIEARASELQVKHAEQDALARLHESDASMAALAEQLGRLGSAVRSAEQESTRLVVARATAASSLDNATQGMRELEVRWAAAAEPAGQTASSDQPHGADGTDSTDGTDSSDEPSVAERDRLRAAAEAARAVETDARLALRTAEERVRGLAGRADALDRQARAERTARAQAAQRAARQERDAQVAGAVGAACDVVLEQLDRSLEQAAQERDTAQEVRAAAERDLAEVRAALKAAGAALDALVDAVHRDELVKAQGAARVEALETKATEELGIDPTTLVAEYGPDQLVPPSPVVPGETRDVEPEPVPYDREAQTRRLRSAERSLAQLGRVNPLALEEFSALEERHAFLVEQLADLTATRRSLLEIIREVDERVEEVFAEAFADTAREFEVVFARLFPGGEGRLVLTDPADLLNTGIEVEARPPGKKIKRLSLLSGGERSLVAVAILVAIFKARPSPFYILDEVEAALDDTNLSRLLTLYEELRESSQLIVITHQKRTMEIADALYGVTMRGDGVSTVISQRLREDASV